MEIPLNKRDLVNTYIRDQFVVIPDIVVEYQQRAKDHSIPQHHISPEAGLLLQILATSIHATKILEVGTLWGYSAWWLAQAVGTDGTVIALEKQGKFYKFAKQFFAAAELGQIDLRRADALDVMPSFAEGEFDMVFIDADKREYPKLAEDAVRILKPGGYLVIDNVIFSSNWNDETAADVVDHTSIQAVQQCNHWIAQHEQLLGVPLAINSGMMVALKT